MRAVESEQLLIERAVPGVPIGALSADSPAPCILRLIRETSRQPFRQYQIQRVVGGVVRVRDQPHALELRIDLNKILGKTAVPDKSQLVP